MEILKNSTRFWKFCGVYLPTSSSTKEYCLSIVSVLVLLGGLQAAYWLSFAYIITEQGKVDTVSLFYVVLQISSTSAVFGPYVSALFVRGSLGELVEQLKYVVDESKYYGQTKFDWTRANLDQLIILLLLVGIKRQRNFLYEKVERNTNLLAKWPLILLLGIFGGIKIITLIGCGLRDLIRGDAFDSSKYYDLLILK